MVPPSPELEARIIATQRILRTGQNLPAAPSDETLDLRTFLAVKARPPVTRRETLVATSREQAPVTGTKRVVVLLVDFPDHAATASLQHYKDLLFSSGTYATGSLRDYYDEVSYHQLTVTGEVFGWFRAPHPKSYYTNNNYGFGSYPQNAQRLVEDVLTLANPVVNFAPFDNDGDGTIEALVIIAAGTGAEVTGNTNDIWSHKWGITPRALDGVSASNYFMAPEDGRVGVMAHELGHLLLGMPDLYDVDYSSRGTGSWDLMAGGSWNNGGNTPAHPVAWVKAKVGWANVTTIFNAEQNVTLLPYKDSRQLYKLPIGTAGSPQYFLLSNRRRLGFDAYLPGEGLIIEHIDENQGNNTDENHYLVDVEQSDGKADLNKNANSGDAGDPFPGAGHTSFTVGTTPSSRAYDGSDSKVEVTAIANSGSNITATVKVGTVTVTGWVYSKLVVQTFASADSQNAWAYIESVGWRKIKTGAADGVTDLFALFCEAQANGQRVTVFVDASVVSIAYLG